MCICGSELALLLLKGILEQNEVRGHLNRDGRCESTSPKGKCASRNSVSYAILAPVADEYQTLKVLRCSGEELELVKLAQELLDDCKR